jgi:hypothetical protein
MENTSGSVDDQLTRKFSTLVVGDGRVWVHHQPTDGAAVRRDRWGTEGDLLPHFRGQNFFSIIKKDAKVSALVNGR